MKTRIITLVVLMMVLIGSGCRAKVAQSSRFAVGSAIGNQDRVGTFPIENLAKNPFGHVQSNNRVFLWHDDFDGEDVEKILAVLYRMEDLDEIGAHLVLDRDRVLNEVEELEDEVRGHRKRIKKAKKKIKKVDASLEEEFLKPVEERDLDLIEELEMEKDAQEVKILEHEAAIEAVKLELSPKEAELIELETKLGASNDEMAEHLERVRDWVEWFEKPPTALVFRAIEQDNGEIRPVVDLYQWDVKDGLGRRDFLTDMGDVTDITYQDFGGQLEFKVHTRPDEYYQFELARSKYDEPTKRVHYSGDITRYRKGRAPQPGIIKFSDGLVE